MLRERNLSTIRTNYSHLCVNQLRPGVRVAHGSECRVRSWLRQPELLPRKHVGARRGVTLHVRNKDVVGHRGFSGTVSNNRVAAPAGNCYCKL